MNVFFCENVSLLVGFESLEGNSVQNCLKENLSWDFCQWKQLRGPRMKKRVLAIVFLRYSPVLLPRQPMPWPWRLSETRESKHVCCAEEALNQCFSKLWIYIVLALTNSETLTGFFSEPDVRFRELFYLQNIVGKYVGEISRNI